MPWETVLRLEQKDFGSNRKKAPILSEQILRLEAEEHLLRRTGKVEGDEHFSS